jgi:hypothetical protein
MTSEHEQAPWKTFESEVASLFRLKGYDARNDLLVAGRQTDVILESPLESMGSSVIECKFRAPDTRSLVTVEEVEAFAARVLRLRAAGDVATGYLVTNRDFTRQARACLTGRPESKFVFLRTLDELRATLINFGPYLKRVVASYEQEGLPATYEPVDARPHEHREGTVQCDEVLLRFTTRGSESLLILAGDYGMGKTTTLRHVAYVLARRLLEGSADRIPVFIPLKWYAQTGAAIGLVQRFLSEQTLGHGTLDAFLAMHAAGKILLILDGFDEMARRTTARSRNESLSDIAAFSVPGSKVIISGRPGYFPEDRELSTSLRAVGVSDTRDRIRRALQEVFATRSTGRRKPWLRFDLLYFSGAKIESYLGRRFTQKQLPKVLTFIRTTYNLEDLSRRPILLEMISETFKHNRHRVIVNAAGMYEVYVSTWLDIEADKGFFRQLVTKDDRLAFSSALAAILQTSGADSIHWTDLQLIVRKFFKLEEPDDIDHFAGDVRTCTFLHRNDEGYYFFAHQSFQEYFCARFIVEASNELWNLIQDADWAGERLDNLSGATVDFVSDLVGVPLRARFWETLQERIAPFESVLRWQSGRARDGAFAVIASLAAGEVTPLDLREDHRTFRDTYCDLIAACKGAPTSGLRSVVEMLERRISA